MKKTQQMERDCQIILTMKNLPKIKEPQINNLKASENRSEDIFRFGCGAALDPSSYFENNLTYHYNPSDKEEIYQRIEEITSFDDHQIKTDIDFDEFLSEGICIKYFQKLFKMEAEEDKTAIKVNNP